MNPADRFERELGAALADLAAARTPDYFPDLLQLTARQRQRPAWASLERWLPMDTATPMVATPSFPWRRLAIVGLIALLLAAAVAVFVGAPLQRPAPLFGPAVNGAIAYEVDGDLYLGDPAAGTSRAIVTGPERESMPAFSLDGTRMAFLRATDSGSAHVVVASATGADQVVVTPEPIRGLTEMAISPDGSQVLIAGWKSSDEHLALAAADGSGVRWLDTGGKAILPSFRPGHPSTVLFVQLGATSLEGQAIRTIDTETGAVTTLVEPVPNGQVVGAPRYSEDGERLTYSLWIPGVENARIFVARADGSQPVAVPRPPGTCCEGHAVWSHDGTKLALIRWYDPGASEPVAGERIAVVDPEVGGTGVEFDVGPMSVGTLSFSPDDRYVLAVPFAHGDETGASRLPQVLLDVESGQVIPPGWEATTDPAWQRLAP